MCIATEESFFILRYSAEAVEKAKDKPDAVTEDGIEEAFDVSFLLLCHSSTLSKSSVVYHEFILCLPLFLYLI